MVVAFLSEEEVSGFSINLSDPSTTVFNLSEGMVVVLITVAESVLCNSSVPSGPSEYWWSPVQDSIGVDS
jgi:hypothetical protein